MFAECPPTLVSPAINRKFVFCQWREWCTVLSPFGTSRGSLNSLRLFGPRSITFGGICIGRFIIRVLSIESAADARSKTRPVFFAVAQHNFLNNLPESWLRWMPLTLFVAFPSAGDATSADPARIRRFFLSLSAFFSSFLMESPAMNKSCGFHCYTNISLALVVIWMNRCLPSPRKKFTWHRVSSRWISRNNNRK